MADFGYQSAGAVKGTWDAKTAYAEETPVPMGPFEAAGHSFEAVHALARRISMLADRLVGPVATDASASQAGLQSKPPMFVALHVEAERAAQSIRDANYELERIERQLA